MDSRFKFSSSIELGGFIAIISCFGASLLAAFLYGYIFFSSLLDNSEPIKLEAPGNSIWGMPLFYFTILTGIAVLCSIGLILLSLFFTKQRFKCLDHYVALILFLPCSPIIILFGHTVFSALAYYLNK
jgi:hypothetical protein